MGHTSQYGPVRTRRDTMRTYKTHQSDKRLFNRAVRNGIIPKHELSLYMYMHSDDLFDYFKHRYTRKYVKNYRPQHIEAI